MQEDDDRFLVIADEAATLRVEQGLRLGTLAFGLLRKMKLEGCYVSFFRCRRHARRRDGPGIEEQGTGVATFFLFKELRFPSVTSETATGWRPLLSEIGPCHIRTSSQFAPANLV
jgi:hypothetical protein